MKTNVGTLDRALRIAAGLLLSGLALSGVIGPWGWLGLLLVMTGVLRHCSAYALLGISTCKVR